MTTPADAALSPTRTTGLVSLDGRAYPLESAAIRARAEGGIALTTLTQRYRNPYAEPLEVLYTLPLPADGAVVSYTVTTGERRITGEVRPRAEAEREFRDALIEGRPAALLEQDRDDTFSQRLGCVPSGQPVEVEIAVLQPLSFRAASEDEPARWEYRFPTVVGVRYEGAPGRVPDAARLDVDRASDGTPVRFELDLTVADGSPGVLGIDSPSHDVSVRPEDAAARVTLAGPAPLDRDLVVHWSAGADEVGLRVVEGPGLPGDDGRYALLTVTPPARLASGAARDLTLLIDTSGSMRHEPIACAREIAIDLLRSLGPGDRFEVLAFSNSVERLTRRPVDASPNNVLDAVAAIGRLEAGGGTEMASAVTAALRPLRPDAQRQVVLLTDGDVGFEPEIVGGVVRNLPVGARLHVVGIGPAPNRSLTLAASRAGRGVEVLAATRADVVDAARRLRSATVAPILTELEARGGAVHGVATARPRDVLAGQPLRLAVELGASGGTLEVAGREADSGRRWTRAVEIPARGREGGVGRTSLPIGALYGREAIADAEMLLAAGGERDVSLESGIETLGMRHRIASRRTSLVAIAEEPSVDPKLPRRRERLAVEIPAGLSAEGLGLAARGRGGTRGFRFANRQALLDLATPASWDEASEEWLRETSGYPLPPGQGTPEPEAFTIGGVSVLRAAGRDLVIEFQVPIDTLELPRGEIAVTAEGVFEARARIVAERSTAPGLHPAGLVVRLALRLPRHLAWVAEVPIVLRWETGSNLSLAALPKSALVVVGPVELRFTIASSELGK